MRRSPADGDGRAAAAGAGAAAGRDACAASWRAARAWARRSAALERPTRGARRGPRRAPTTRTPTRWSAGSRSAAPTSTSAPRAVAADLGLGVELERPMTALSGGQAARASLASLLLSRYDLFLLDEPTNDLDLDGLERLERFVRGLRAGTVLVSHDREFLARTVDRVLELDLAQQQVNHFGGGYEAYLEQREVARRHAPRGLRGVRRHARGAAGAGAHAARVDGEGRAKRPPQGPGPRQDRAQPTASSRREKQASKARQTERHAGAAGGGRRAARASGSCACRSPRAPRSGAVVATPARRGRAPRGVHARAR